MKLTEIFQPEVKQANRGDKPVNTVVRQRAKQSDPKDPNFLGRGAFSRAETHPNLPPGMIVRYGRAGGAAKYDGYLNWLKQLVKGERMASNPYLPRIYNIKFIDESQYVIIMEKLNDFKTASSAEIEAIGDLAFGQGGNLLQTLLYHSPRHVTEGYQDSDERIKRRKYSSEEQREEAIQRNKNEFIRAAFPKMLQNVVEGNVSTDVISDDALKEALSFIGDAEFGAKDMHNGNIMIRRGPTGAQLVITDPLA